MLENERIETVKATSMWIKQWAELLKENGKRKAKTIKKESTGNAKVPIAEYC